MAWWSKLFGSDKGIIEQVSDVADKWIPSETTKHKMGIEDLQAGAAYVGVRFIGIEPMMQADTGFYEDKYLG